LLTLIVSLLMSWYASKLKQVLAQKRAVEAILAEKCTVEYDYEFDEAGREIKGAKGHGPAWLRGLFGPDQFDTVVHVWVESAKGMEAVNGLARLRSLSIDARGNSEDPLKYLQDIDGLEELDISGFITDAGLERVRELRHLKCLKLSLQGPSNNPRKEKPITGACLAAVLRSCPTLLELTIDNAELPAAALDQIATLSQLEKLTLFNINSGPAVVFRIDKLTALRELELMDSADRDNGNSLTFGEIKGIRSLSRLERLHLWSKAVTDSDVERISKLPLLRELDLHENNIGGSDIVNLKDLSLLEELDLSKTYVDDESIAVLAGLKNLKRLDLMGSHVRGPGLRRLYGLRQQLAVRITLNDEDMEFIDGAVPIVALQLSFCPLTDNGCYHIAFYPMLQERDLQSSDLNDARVENLAELTRLKKLNLMNNHITDAALRHLRGLTELRELSLAFTDVRGPGLEVLKNMPRLESLSLSNLPLHDEDLKHLDGLLQLRELVITDNRLTNAGLDHLAGLKQLRKIYIRSPWITPQGKQKLRAAVPGLKFEGEE